MKNTEKVGIERKKDPRHLEGVNWPATLDGPATIQV